MQKTKAIVTLVILALALTGLAGAAAIEKYSAGKLIIDTVGGPVTFYYKLQDENGSWTGTEYKTLNLMSAALGGVQRQIDISEFASSTAESIANGKTKHHIKIWVQDSASVSNSIVLPK